MNHYLFLSISIALEVCATLALKMSDGFSKLDFAILSLTLYGICFYCFSQALKVVPVGIAYAIWSGAGIVLTSILSFIFFAQKIDLPAFIGMSLIVLGVLITNLFSHSLSH